MGNRMRLRRPMQCARLLVGLVRLPRGSDRTRRRGPKSLPSRRRLPGQASRTQSPPRLRSRGRAGAIHSQNRPKSPSCGARGCQYQPTRRREPRAPQSWRGQPRSRPTLQRPADHQDLVRRCVCSYGQCRFASGPHELASGVHRAEGVVGVVIAPTVLGAAAATGEDVRVIDALVLGDGIVELAS